MFSQELQLPLTPEHGWGGKLRSQSQGELPYHLAGVCTELILSQGRLSSFVLNSVFRTSPKLQSSCNLEGQIDLLLHHSCTQAVVSHKARGSDAVHPARWELG